MDFDPVFVEIGVGTVGGMLAAIDGKTVGSYDRAGKLLFGGVSGGATSFAVAPLVSLVWTSAPVPLTVAAAFILGIIGVPIIRSVRRWGDNADFAALIFRAIGKSPDGNGNSSNVPSVLKNKSPGDPPTPLPPTRA